MKISIVTPVYNDPRIKYCLESVHSQTGDFELEHIVVDGDSNDETVAVLKEYQEEIDVLIREPDDGVYDAMNRGIERATGEIVGILNSDDRYQDTSVLNEVYRRMVDTDADACYGDLVYVDDDDTVVRYWESGEYAPAKFHRGWMPPHPTFFVRRELYDRFGKFDVTLPIAADYDLMLRFLYGTDVTVTYINRVLVRMALGGQSNASFRNRLRLIKDMYDAWGKTGSRLRFVAPVLHPIEKVPQFLKPKLGISEYPSTPSIDSS